MCHFRKNNQLLYSDINNECFVLSLQEANSSTNTKLLWMNSSQTNSISAGLWRPSELRHRTHCGAAPGGPASCEAAAPGGPSAVEISFSREPVDAKWLKPVIWYKTALIYRKSTCLINNSGFILCKAH